MWGKKKRNHQQGAVTGGGSRKGSGVHKGSRTRGGKRPRYRLPKGGTEKRLGGKSKVHVSTNEGGRISKKSGQKVGGGRSG